MADIYREFQLLQVRKAAILALVHNNLVNGSTYANSVTLMGLGYEGDRELANERHQQAFELVMQLKGLR